MNKLGVIQCINWVYQCYVCIEWPCTSDRQVLGKYYMLFLVIMIILYLFLPDFFCEIPCCGFSIYVVPYARKETIEERVFTCYRSIYSCGCEGEGATPLRTRVI